MADPDTFKKGGTEWLRGDPLQSCSSDSLNDQLNFSQKGGGGWGMENPLNLPFNMYFLDSNNKIIPNFKVLSVTSSTLTCEVMGSNLEITQKM